MEGILEMSAKERKRMKVLERVKEKKLSLKAAAILLALSYRQTVRVYGRYRMKGDEGLVHLGRGKRANNAYDEKLRRKILDRYRSHYEGFGPTLAAEKLCEEGMKVDHNTLWRWLLQEGLWKRCRKSNPYRQRRERKKHFGEMLQLDGSHHSWFEDRGNPCCLMNLVDDATGITLSILVEQETTEAAMKLLWAWIRRYGIPYSIYCDRKSVYITEREPTLEEQLAGVEPLTVFGRACQKLGILIITAYSPQAKGRVERNHGVYQDRFVKELRLRGINTVAAASTLLKSGFSDGLNRRFAKQPASTEDFHVPILDGTNLRAVFCYEVERTISRDWVVQNDCRRFQILLEAKPRPRAGSKVVVALWLDGSIHILSKGKEILFEEIEPIAGREAKEAV